jgi:hypothetical protein
MTVFLGLVAFIIGWLILLAVSTSMYIDGVEVTFANPSEVRMMVWGAAIFLVGIFLLIFG